jgi:membrane protein implicated in regulation of membrane protease activity
MSIHYIWLIVIIVTALVEAATIQLVAIWLVAGGIAGLITSLFTDNVYIQCAVFIIVVVVSFLVFMPLIRKSRLVKKVSTNADRYLGKTGVVIENIDNIQGTGQVKVLGNVWTAKTKDGNAIEKGSDVLVLEISGAKLIVEKLKQNENMEV